jgi:hydrogenase nickel incorporation protein HypA/HybF
MHELSLAEEILRIVEETSQAQGVRRVHRVQMVIGVLASVEVEALRFAFDSLAPGTVAAGAALEIASVPATGTCVACGAEELLVDRFEACPRCGGGPRKAAGGTEFRVQSLEGE